MHQVKLNNVLTFINKNQKLLLISEDLFQRIAASWIIFLFPKTSAMDTKEPEPEKVLSIANDQSNNSPS